MYEICLHVNCMFQFEIKIDYRFTYFFFFQNTQFFGYLPMPRINTWVNTQKLFTYPLCIYPPHVTRATAFSAVREIVSFISSRFRIPWVLARVRFCENTTEFLTQTEKAIFFKVNIAIKQFYVFYLYYCW